MNEGNYKLNIRTVADTSGVEKVSQEMKGLASDVQGLGRLLDVALQSGFAEKPVTFDNILKAGPMLIQAAELGSQIGEAIGGAIERVHDRGFGLDAILGRYDARFDESIGKWRDGVKAMLADLGKEPPRTMLDYLDELKQKTQEAIDLHEHHAKLQGLKDKGIQREQDRGLTQERKDIEGNQRLSPEQREAALAELDKKEEKIGFERRQAERNGEVEAAFKEEEEKGKQATAARAARDEQKERVKQAEKAELEGQWEWEQAGGQGAASKSEAGQKFLRERRPEGIGTAKDEEEQLNKAEAVLEKAQKEHRAKRMKREQVGEVIEVERDEDLKTTRAKMGDIDANLRDKRAGRYVEAEDKKGEEARNAAYADGVSKASPEKLDDAANAATSAAEDVGKSAEKLATSAADSSGRIAEDLRQLTQVMTSSMTSIQGAVADNSRAIQALAQRTDQASQMAAAALAAVKDAQAGTRINRR